MSIYNLELVKDKRYRITTADEYSEVDGKRYFIGKGKKFRVNFVGTIENFMPKIFGKGIRAFCFEYLYNNAKGLVCQTQSYAVSKTESTIAKIEEVEEISIEEQAEQKGCWDEYLKYQTINGKTPRRQFIYTEVK
tara:strand:+ start:140 stop:544 length:405 start_codon:yes stop_codon:yes gene_type:complete